MGINIQLFNLIDVSLLFLLTVPIFVVYIIYTMIYFTVIDKNNYKRDKDHIKHGLSRFILGGIFFLFGLILFDIIIEFFSFYIVEFKEGNPVFDYIKDSIMAVKMTEDIKKFPINILINFAILCTSIYTGTEGAIASLKTMKIDSGLVIELPAIKRKRLRAIFYIWGYISVITTIYTLILGKSESDFNLSNIYVGLCTTLVISFVAERSSSVLGNAKKKNIETHNNVVDSYSSNSEILYDFIENMDETINISSQGGNNEQ